MLDRVDQMFAFFKEVLHFFFGVVTFHIQDQILSEFVHKVVAPVASHYFRNLEINNLQFALSV